MLKKLLKKKSYKLLIFVLLMSTSPSMSVLTAPNSYRDIMPKALMGSLSPNADFNIAEKTNKSTSVCSYSMKYNVRPPPRML